MDQQQARKDPTFAVGVAAGASLLLASLANFLGHNVYPLLRIEVGIAVLSILILSGLMAPFYLAQRQWGRSFLEGLLTALFFDLNSDSIALIILSGIAVAGYTYWRRVSLLRPISFMGTVIFLLTVAGVGVRSDWISNHSADHGINTNQQSSILHVILDEHIGIEGLPRDNKDASALREKLISSYINEGFTLYGGAYSEHLHTINAIPNILNYGMLAQHDASVDGVIVGSTEHLKRLNSLRYNVSVFQSDFADYCAGSEYDRCITYDSSALAPTLAVPMDYMDRFELMMFKLAKLSNVANLAVDAYSLFVLKLSSSPRTAPRPLFDDGSRSSTVGTIEALNRLKSVLKEARPGDAYLVHLLMPHYPYVVDERCNYLPRSQWRARHSRISQDAKLNAYYQQIECSTRLLFDLVNTFEDSPAGKNSVVIVHGDHGSRITRYDPNAPNLGNFTTSDAIAGFSTLFAVKVPGVAPRYDGTFQPASALLEELGNSQFKSAPKTNHPLRPLQLDNWNWEVVEEIDLPLNWADRSHRPSVTP